MRAWLPLAASWLLMGLELPAVSAVMARLPDPERSLAAYGGVVFPLALLIESPTDAVVRVTTTALCGADLFPYHGHVPGFLAGTILGHEYVGVVESVGSAVATVKPGDRVVSNSTISCGR